MEEIIKPNKEDIPKEKIESVTKQESQQKYLGSLIKRPGQKIYRVNTETLEIDIAPTEVYVQTDFLMDGTSVSVPKTQVTIDSQYRYCQALNVRNAKKVFKREYGLIIP